MPPKTKTETVALDAETQEKVAALTVERDAAVAKAEALEALIESTLDGLFRSKYVLSLIPDKKAAAAQANEVYIKLRDALGDKGREMDKKFRGL